MNSGKRQFLAAGRERLAGLLRRLFVRAGHQSDIPCVELAAARRLPVVAGGDRHGFEPNAIVNLTQAATIEEFIEDVRIHGASDVLFLPPMKESRRVRILHTICDIVRDNPEHELGWRRWSDRFFYQCDSGAVRSLSELWSTGKEPAIIRNFVGLMHRLRASLGNTLDAVRTAASRWRISRTSAPEAG